MILKVNSWPILEYSSVQAGELSGKQLPKLSCKVVKKEKEVESDRSHNYPNLGQPSLVLHIWVVQGVIFQQSESQQVLSHHEFIHHSEPIEKFVFKGFIMNKVDLWQYLD